MFARPLTRCMQRCTRETRALSGLQSSFSTSTQHLSSNSSQQVPPFSNTPSSTSSPVSATPKAFVPPATWSADTKESLSLIKNQPNHWAIVEIKQRPYYVALNDVIVTMRMNDVSIGDISSDEYILKGHPYLYPGYFTVKATVVEHPVSAEIVRHHWKKRGHQPVIVNRNHHTALRITEISIKDV
ncbi:hypothetical protein BC829DRAFT_384605 [Chytridium lagenaria]|nr:hypothetical protein BC829DRAFT_384605 [Chytridium lagenaria]